MIGRALAITGLMGIVALCEAGTITGTVRAEGKTGPSMDGGSGKYDSRKFKFAERVDYSAMRDFVVMLDGPLSGDFAPPDKPVKVITQKDATFSPHVLPILVGTTVEWPNKDEIFHNAFSVSENNSFDLGLYKSEVRLWTFKKPGRVDVFCSIHTAMHCIILVVENPYFAGTDPKGHYTIKAVPAGIYKLKAWHERMPPQIKEINVPADGDLRVDFLLGISNLPESQ